MRAIVPVVEGPGDVAAVPILVRRLLRERLGRADVAVSWAKKANGRHGLVRDLEKFLDHGARTPQAAAILVLLDADSDCAMALAQTLAERAKAKRLSIPVAVVCARREYESWFLASVDSIRGKRGISLALFVNRPPDDVGSVKSLLTRHMPPGRAYREATDQAPLTAAIDLSLAARRSRSFRRLCHAIEQLVQAMDSGAAAVTP